MRKLGLGRPISSKGLPGLWAPPGVARSVNPQGQSEHCTAMEWPREGSSCQSLVCPQLPGQGGRGLEAEQSLAPAGAWPLAGWRDDTRTLARPPEALPAACDHWSSACPILESLLRPRLPAGPTSSLNPRAASAQPCPLLPWSYRRVPGLLPSPTHRPAVLSHL